MLQESHFYIFLLPLSPHFYYIVTRKTANNSRVVYAQQEQLSRTHNHMETIGNTWSDHTGRLCMSSAAAAVQIIPSLFDSEKYKVLIGSILIFRYFLIVLWPGQPFCMHFYIYIQFARWLSSNKNAHNEAKVLVDELSSAGCVEREVRPPSDKTFKRREKKKWGERWNFLYFFLYSFLLFRWAQEQSRDSMESITRWKLKRDFLLFFVCSPHRGPQRTPSSLSSKRRNRGKLRH